MVVGIGDLEIFGIVIVGNDVIFWFGLLERGEVDRIVEGS